MSAKFGKTWRGDGGAYAHEASFRKEERTCQKCGKIFEDSPLSKVCWNCQVERMRENGKKWYRENKERARENGRRQKERKKT